MNLFRRIKDEDTGAVFSTELVLVTAVAIVGVLSGLNSVRTAVIGELNQLAHTVQAVSPWTDGSEIHQPSQQVIREIDACTAVESLLP